MGCGAHMVARACRSPRGVERRVCFESPLVVSPGLVDVDPEAVVRRLTRRSPLLIHDTVVRIVQVHISHAFVWLWRVGELGASLLLAQCAAAGTLMFIIRL
jgi:hypothetical protein